MSRGTTLQINSLEALERLLGGDTQLEVDLRQSVVAAFAKKHLKALATLPLFESFSSELRDELGREVKSKIDEIVGRELNSWSERKVVLSARLLEEINAKVRVAAEAAYTKAFADYGSPLIDKLEQKILLRVEQIVDRNFQQRVDAAVQVRLNAIKAGL